MISANARDRPIAAGQHPTPMRVPHKATIHGRTETWMQVSGGAVFFDLRARTAVPIRPGSKLEEPAMSPLTLKAGHVARFASDEERWEAVRRRDPAAVGAFVYGVATTAIYCLPGCGARLPRRENVSFHASCADAEQAGLRPCKRCRPNETLPAARNVRQKRKPVDGEALT
jgi:hypothetical protein